ncbi:MAG TPA: hypothetical protein PLF37_01535 [Planctomycetota bacterium]|nr:hypothetical protein [Planctomycetota bacterium]
MRYESFRWLASVIGAHPENKVVGRTRLQKTIWLLQRLGLKTDYTYRTHFYGPYSEDLHAELGLLERFGMVSEEPKEKRDGTPYFIIHAKDTEHLPELPDKLGKALRVISGTKDPVVLELAATYDAFRSQGSDHTEALERLRRKKGKKCEGDREEKALTLLAQLGLDAS